ncbi:hypothetical protein [Pseudarthrobacter sp. BIM B-2242]|uniref:hypothetical protein n=1 Tax=Pseudarthrobacter sp. BIM B-2242 TaxID=2772401 RepID=UPI00168BEC7F|nr:hypothetical protein [Pseudarthrobacter sp. BIM B-2242]QOD05949.1 hypothetical protein IDT60_20485 [Pseudarthrobacter sp. BIM B-2242]
MESPNAPSTARALQGATGNFKVAIAFLYFTVTATYLAMTALGGTHVDTVFWVWPLVIPLAMGITGWNTGRPLTAEEARQRADISRWDV